MDIFQFQGLFLILAATTGYFLNNAESRKVSAFINVWINLPVLFFVTFLQNGFQVIEIKIFLAAIAYSIIMLVLALIITRNYEPSVRGSIIINSLFMNTINLPISILLAFGYAYSLSVAFAAYMTILRLPILMFIENYLSRSKIKEVKVSGKRRINISRYLPIIAFLVGGGLHYAIPDVNSFLTSNLVNSINLFIILIILYEFGYQLRGIVKDVTFTQLKGYFSPFVVISTSRLILSPILIYIVLLVLGITSRQAIGQIMVTGLMSPAITNVVWSRLYEFDIRIVVLSTLILTPICAVVAITFLLLY
ncbi:MULTISPECIES: hypothetical protein [Metallosphaera]|uniref:AEC family transporter n=1 Tax=Metallosphaera prunae TaxID=47304 RepID=A0A4D8RVT8_METPR|nr:MULTISPECIES: hypothetical protein [Metallosphaera]QCO29117.1 hypothetical protein DFR88_00315 [Metallosphaera prunae]BBL47303.1 auxin efflux carrier family protein [Metallosphaera sedula]